MEKYVPYEKLSKKKKRELNASRRNTWGNLNPVTRKPDPHKAYNRKKTQDWKKELPDPASFLFALASRILIIRQRLCGEHRSTTRLYT